MSIELKMPALSPTMEEGTVAKWLVAVGDLVKRGDLIAEIETDKATMEFEAVDEGRIASILIPEGTDGVAVGTVIAMLASSEGAGPVVSSPASATIKAEPEERLPQTVAVPVDAPLSAPIPQKGPKVRASPLATRIANARNIDLNGIGGSGSGGRIVRKDLGLPASTDVQHVETSASSRAAPAESRHPIADLPHDLVKMTSMRKTIARRLTESKQQVPHIYLSVDVRVDALLALRTTLNEAGAARGSKVSVNDMIIKALGLALVEVPACNVQYAGDHFAQFKRVDISVAVSIPGGLVTPVVTGADGKSISAISAEMRELAERARAGKLQLHELGGGTASLSNLGMFGITQFDAVINPPQGMILAVGAAVQRACVIENAVTTAMMMTATGSFDHRVIDGADAALCMQAFRRLVENPLQLF